MVPAGLLKKEFFICLDNAAFTRIVMRSRIAQKAMTPAKGGVLADAAVLGRRPHGQPSNKCLGIIQPAVLFSQTRQGCTGQCVARAATGLAAIALQATTATP